MKIFAILPDPASLAFCILVCSAALSIGLIAVPALAAGDQDSIEAYLGDTIDLHGVSYSAPRLYLFLTGPGLPANGVTLTDTSQLASQGHFTIVDVANDQTWYMKWNTDRIRNQINPGTYKVYVSTTPTDLSGLTSGYKVMSVYLKDPGPRNGVSISASGGYTLNPEAHVYTRTETPAPVVSTTTASVPSPTVTPVLVPEQTSLPPTKKSSLSAFTAPAAALGAGVAFMLLVRRRDP